MRNESLTDSHMASSVDWSSHRIAHDVKNQLQEIEVKSFVKFSLRRSNYKMKWFLPDRESLEFASVKFAVCQTQNHRLLSSMALEWIRSLKIYLQRKRKKRTKKIIFKFEIQNWRFVETMNCFRLNERSVESRNRKWFYSFIKTILAHNYNVFIRGAHERTLRAKAHSRELNAERKRLNWNYRLGQNEFRSGRKVQLVALHFSTAIADPSATGRMVASHRFRSWLRRSKKKRK